MTLLNLTEFKKELKKLGEAAASHSFGLSSHEAKKMSMGDLVSLHLDYYKSGLSFEEWFKEYVRVKSAKKVIVKNPIRLRCPFCGCDRFKRRCDDEVHMLDDRETVTDELVAEPWSMDYTYTCSNCGKDVTNMELNKCFGDRSCSDADAMKCKLGQHCTDLANM